MMKARTHLGTQARRVTAVGAAVLSVAFAAWPVAVSQPTSTAPVITNPEPAKKQLAALDLAAFRVPLWVADPAPPPPPVPTAPAAPPPPLRLQLLAIIHEGDVYKAAVYDPDTDRILVVGAGEKIGMRSVDSVGKNTLTLRDDTGKRILALQTAGEGGGGS